MLQLDFMIILTDSVVIDILVDNEQKNGKAKMKTKLCMSISVATIGFLLAVKADACSWDPSFLPASNYDLVRQADAIVLARAVDTGSGDIAMVPFKILKGQVDVHAVKVEGVISKELLKETEDFSSGHHSVCESDEYQLESTYVVLLSKKKRGWVAEDSLFGRPVEFVNSEDSNWVRAVKEYISIAAMDNPVREKAELKKRLVAAQSNKSDHYEKILVKDIQTHFDTPYPSKTFPELLAIYNKVKSKEWEKFNVFFAMAEGNSSAAEKFFIRLVDDMKLLRNPASYKKELAQDAISIYLINTHNSKMLGDLIDRYETIGKRYERGFPFLEKAIDLVPSSKYEFMLRQMNGYLIFGNAAYREEQASWISDWFIGRPTNRVVQAIDVAIKSDYADHEQLAMALAKLADRGVFNWAKVNILSVGKNRDIAYEVIGAFPGSESLSIIRRTVEVGAAADIINVIEGCSHRTALNDCMNFFDKIAEKYVDNNEVKAELRNTLEVAYRQGRLADTHLLQRLYPDELH